MIIGTFKLRCHFLLDNWQVSVEENGGFEVDLKRSLKVLSRSLSLSLEGIVLSL